MGHKTISGRLRRCRLRRRRLRRRQLRRRRLRHRQLRRRWRGVERVDVLAAGEGQEK